MTTAAPISRRLSWWEYWPVIVAVFIGHFGGLFLARWMAFHYAVAIASFVGWTFAGLVWIRKVTPRLGLPRWAVPLIMGITVGVITGVLSYFFPWR